MAKEAYYFSHDANARQDEKILMLLSEHGWEGYGIYWALVEMMFESSETLLNHNKVKGISFSYNIDITLLQSVINTCITEELFVSNGERFWSESLKIRKSKYHEIKTKKSEAGKKGMAKRWGEQQIDNTVIKKDNTVITEYNKGKEMKVNEMKVIKPSIDFESEFQVFWDSYKKKSDKKNAFLKYKIARKKFSFEQIIDGANKYMNKCEVEGISKNYIKGPAVFLHGENFNDEFEIEVKQHVSNGHVDFDSLRRELENEQNTSITHHPNNNDILPRKI